MFTIVLENMKLKHFFLLSTWVENVFPCGFRVVSVCVLSNPHQMCNFPMGSSYFPMGSFKPTRFNYFPVLPFKTDKEIRISSFFARRDVAYIKTKSK